MGGHAADPGTPFNGWIRKAETELTGRHFEYFLAAIALFNDFVAGTSVKLTPGLTHKEAVRTLLYSLTNRGYHILSI